MKLLHFSSIMIYIKYFVFLWYSIILLFIHFLSLDMQMKFPT